MAIVKLGDIDFSAQVYSHQIDWQNQFVYSSVKTVQDYGWDGDHVVWQNQTHGGRPIHLVAADQESYLNQSHVDYIYTLFNTLGATTPFQYDDKIYQVIVTEFNPERLKGFFDDNNLQLYTATIDLIEVF